MSHLPREDHRGAWWHLYNRGLAKRALFETRQDVERFCELLATRDRAEL